jgi:hypothetical protein
MNVNVNNVFWTGRKSVTTAPSQIEPTGHELYQGLNLLAMSGNTAPIYLGYNSGVNSSSGYPLVASAAQFIPIDDTSKVWVVSGSGTQSVAFLGA